MHLTLQAPQLCEYVAKQLNTFFPDGDTVHAEDLVPSMPRALERLEYCFKHIALKHYCDNGVSQFNHLFADQYLVFLWFLANQTWQDGGRPSLLNKLYLLNKALHAFDCLYNTGLPEIFMVVHGVGTVLGKGQYANFFVVHQNCTVGTNGGIYPKTGLGLGMGTGATLIGDCTLGDFVTLGARADVLGVNIPSHSVVFRNKSGVLETRSRPDLKQSIAFQYFGNSLLTACQTTHL